MNGNSNKKNIFYFVILEVFLIFLDQITKTLAVNNLKESNDLILIKGVLQFHYLENTGAAFSVMEGQQLFFLIITPILLIILIYLLMKIPDYKRFSPLKYIIIFIIAGAIGNYIDRFRFKYVVDFIYFSLINFPVFNVADCYVTCSVILLIFLILFYYKDEDFDEIKKNIQSKD